MKDSTKVLVSLGAAVAVGIAIGASGNASLLRLADGIAPIGAVWVNAIRMTVIPLVVSLIITGIASASDVQSVGKLGGRTLIVFVLLLAGVAIVVIPLAPTLFSLLPTRAGTRPSLPMGAAEATEQLLASGQTQTFGTWVTSLIPANPIAAAASGAMVPLILFALLLALAIAHGPATTRATLVAFFKAIADAMAVLVRWIVRVAPIGVFALVLPLAARAGGSLVGAIGFYILAYSVASLVMTALFYPVVAIVGRIPMRSFARAA